MAATVSTVNSLKIVPLGGLGEIGLNLMVVECAGRALIIDAGLMFPEQRALVDGVLMPELGYLEHNRLEIEGIVLTHGHEDHIGALGHLLHRFPAPVYGTEVTLAFARRRLDEEGIKADLKPIFPRRRFEAGPFGVEPIRVTHSTPDSIALAVDTPAGLIVHTGDFKIDPAPVDGQTLDHERFAELGRQGVAVLLSDSTNVERSGRTGSESSIKPVLKELISRTRGKFFLSSFSSHLHRIHQLTEVARETGRLVVPLGRRMAESVRLGVETGVLRFPPGTFIGRGEAEFLEPRKLAFLTSGSQGEPLSALAKLAADSHPRFHVEPGDVVVLSSRFIPGNERTINTLVNHLYRRGAEVHYQAVAPVHVSGHASRDELVEMIKLTRPRYFVPIHGEYRHLSRHMALAIEAGIPERNCFLLEDGDPLVLSREGVRQAQSVETGRVPAEGIELGAADMLEERRLLAREGAVVAILALSAKTGTIVAGPDLISRGLVSGDGTSVYIRRAQAELRSYLEATGVPLRADERIKDEMVRFLRRYFNVALGRTPLVVPYVMEV